MWGLECQGATSTYIDSTLDGRTITRDRMIPPLRPTATTPVTPRKCTAKKLAQRGLAVIRHFHRRGSPVRPSLLDADRGAGGLTRRPATSLDNGARLAPGRCSTPALFPPGVTVGHSRSLWPQTPINFRPAVPADHGGGDGPQRSTSSGRRSRPGDPCPVQVGTPVPGGERRAPGRLRRRQRTSSEVGCHPARRLYM